jgi:hypothetical protein
MAYAVAGLLLLVLAIYHYPWAVLGALAGGALAALAPKRADDPATKRGWRRAAWAEIASGAALLLAYLGLRAPLGLAAAAARFASTWHDGLHVHPGALAARPWGWLPLALIVGLLAAGLVTRWRAR